jgi:uncharacterized protein YhfF/ribosomal protein S18 acetylase RimI-like enzyme
MADTPPPASALRSNDSIAAFWTGYCARAGLPATTPYQAWPFGDSPQLAHELAELVLHGPKRATAGLVAWNELHPEDAAVPDGYSVVTEFDGTPRCVIRTVWLDRRPLRDVDAGFAWDEGEGDRTLADWLDGHRHYFMRTCPPLGIAFSDDMPVQLERFELLYPFEAALHPVDCGPRIVPGYLPGAIGTIAAEHARLHAREFGFGAPFEAQIAAQCAQFVTRFDPARDGLWLLVDGGRILGSIALEDLGEDGARLRWFIVADALRGRGFGARLLQAALEFGRRAGHRRVTLSTAAGLDAARGLYERNGFRLVRETEADLFGSTVRERIYEWSA